MSVKTSMLISAVLICVCRSGAAASASLRNRYDCPNRGYDSHGYWSVDDKDGPRCILTCHRNHKPSSCNVLRPKTGGWNKPIPVCEKEPFVSGKTVLVVGTGVAAVFAAPVVLTAAGFTAAGVAAGSMAAFLQTPFTAAGSWFAASQSAGVLGMAATTKLGIGAATGGATYVVSSLFSDCEAE